MSLIRLTGGMLILLVFAVLTGFEGNASIGISIIYAAWMISESLNDIKTDLGKMWKGEKT